MPIKWLGAALTILSGILWGLQKSGTLLKRERSLKNIITALGMLESEITFSSHKLKAAFRIISKVCPCEGLFSEAADMLGNASAFCAWQTALEKTEKKLGISEKDVQIIKLLAPELGKSDKEQQIRNLRHVSSLLGTAANEAHEEYLRSAKMYRSLGIFAGLFIAILLI